MKKVMKWVNYIITVIWDFITIAALCVYIQECIAFPRNTHNSWNFRIAYGIMALVMITLTYNSITKFIENKKLKKLAK